MKEVGSCSRSWICTPLGTFVPALEKPQRIPLLSQAISYRVPCPHLILVCQQPVRKIASCRQPPRQTYVEDKQLDKSIVKASDETVCPW